MIVQPVLPAGMLIAALVPVVAVPLNVTLPVYVAVGVWHATVKLYVPGAPVAGAPVTVFVTVSVAGFAVSGLVMVPLAVPLAGKVAGGCVYVAVPQV